MTTMANWQVGDRVLDMGGKHVAFGTIENILPADPSRIDMRAVECVTVRYDQPNVCRACVFKSSDKRLERVRRAGEERQ